MFKNWNRKKTAAAVVIGLLFIAAGISAVLVVVSRRGRDSALLPPEFYFAKDEDIPSVTDVIGDREFENLSEKEALSGQAEPDSQRNGVSVEKYRYFSSGTSDTDVQKYMEYLTENKNFLNTTEPADSREEGGEKKEIYRLTGPSGDGECYLEITIEVEDGGYTVTAVKEGQAWNSYISQLWEEERKEQAQTEPVEQKSTRQKAEEKIGSMSREELKLPEPVDSYEFIAGPGLIYVDGKNFYRISAYRKKENGTLTYECAYLMDYTSGEICFKYNDVTEEKITLR